MRYCTNCGNENAEGSAFCEECGHDLSDGVVAPDSTPAAAGQASSGKGISRKALAYGAAGLVAVIALVVIAVSIISGVGGDARGSSSPEGAVRELSEALGNQDLGGAALLLAPSEVEDLGKAYGEATEAASEGGFGSGESSLEGLEVEISDLDLETQELSDDVAKVEITGGSMKAKIDAAQLSERIRSSPDSPEPLTTGTLTAADLGDELASSAPFLMAIREDGDWYVSPAYTGMEYLRLAEDLPEANFDAGPPSDDYGGDSPEDAINRLTTALGSYDIDALIGLVPPSQAKVLTDYRATVDALVSREGGVSDLSDDFYFTIDDVEVSADEDGNEATATVTSSSGTFGDDFISGSFDQNGPCGNYSTDTGDSGDACIDEEVLYSNATLALAPALENGPRISTVNEGGRWYVDLPDTVIKGARAFVAADGDRRLLTMLGRLDLAETDGSVEADGTASGTLDGMGLAVYTAEGSVSDGDFCEGASSDTYAVGLPSDRLVVVGTPNGEFEVDTNTDC